ncbi:MAG: hypothetical protein HFG62_13180 [Lachnospiraceae bacterium]|jgi:hypothetical protein|nr:hypothetical protein [Lachnospiraceae bacterium]
MYDDGKYYILIAEGVTDCSLLEAILETCLGFVQYQKVSELPTLFREMIGKYPTATGELQRQDSPVFFHRNCVGVAVKQASGCNKIPSKIGMLAELIDKLDTYESFGGFLVFSDTDLKTKDEIREDFASKFQKDGLVFGNDYLILDGNRMVCKLYLFPTSGVGAVEKLLLVCADLSYGQLCQDARRYRDKIMSEEYRELRKKHWVKKEAVQEFYADKVQFGVVSAVLKPDRPVRFAIKDELIRKNFLDLYMGLDEFRELHNFLCENLAM